MADLFGDDFTAAEPPAAPTQEVDPAAAFLAQQEDEIAGAFPTTASYYYH